MQEGFYYVINDDFFDKFTKMGCAFKYNKGNSRPTYCCIKDNIHSGLFWAIPTSSYDVNNENKVNRLNSYLQLPDNDIRSQYYHLGYTNKKAVFCISSAFPITDKYIDHVYTVRNVPLEMKREKMKSDIRKKLLRIITWENQSPNRFETRMTDIKKCLLQELKENN